MFCSKCGAKNVEDAAFCAFCGAPALPAESAEPDVNEPAGDIEDTVSELAFESDSPDKAESGESPVPLESGSVAFPEPVFTDEEPVLAQVTCPAAAQPITGEKTIAPERRRLSFFQDFFNLIIMALIVLLTAYLCYSTPMFLNPTNLMNVLKQYSPMAAVALAVALSVRAKGPDLSIGPVMALSGIILASLTIQGSEWAGLLLAVAISIGIGALNGLVIVFCKMPAIITTLFTSIFIRTATTIFFNGNPIDMRSSYTFLFAAYEYAWLILILAALAIAFLLTFFSVLGKPKVKRNNEALSSKFMFVAAYAGSALIACLAGCYMAGRLGSAMLTVGISYEFYILFIYFALIGSRLLDNRYGGVFYALLPALLWAVAENIMTLLSVSSYVQLGFTIILAFILGICAFVVKKKEPALE